MYAHFVIHLFARLYYKASHKSNTQDDESKHTATEDLCS